MKKFLHSIALIYFCMASGLVWAGENTHWHAIAKLTIAEVHRSLTAQGKCSNEDDCFDRGFIYFSTHDDGVVFGIFRLSDPRIKSNIAAICIRAALLHKIPRIQIDYYNYSIEERNAKSFFDRKPVDKLLIEGKYANN